MAQAPRKAAITATTFTVSWNCKNLAILSYTFLPHMTALTMLVKLSSVRMISEASLATSVPAMPYNKHEAPNISIFFQNNASRLQVIPIHIAKLKQQCGAVL